MRELEIKKEIAELESIRVMSASELFEKDNRLDDLKEEQRLNFISKTSGRGTKSWKPLLNMSEKNAQGKKNYVAFPMANQLLADRIDANPEEIGAWVWMGPHEGGLCAYLNANELEPPPRFYFDSMLHPDGDYLGHLMATWFDELEIGHFEPRDRFITGKQLLQRWGVILGAQAKHFVLAKIKESRILDCHPIFGGTQATFGNEPPFPPLEDGLFTLADVERVEAEDFSNQQQRPLRGSEMPDARRARLIERVRIEKARGARDFLQRIAKEEGLSVSRLKQLVARPKAKKNACGGLGMRSSQTTSKKEKDYS